MPLKFNLEWRLGGGEENQQHDHRGCERHQLQRNGPSHLQRFAVQDPQERYRVCSRKKSSSVRRSVARCDTATPGNRFLIAPDGEREAARINAMLGNPELLLLDEPSNRLDPAGIHEVRTLVRDLSRRRGVTVFLQPFAFRSGAGGHAPGDRFPRPTQV